jgi:ATP-dependent protease ClpP protease subunit
MPSDNTKLVKVKEEKLEENISAKVGEFHTRRRYNDEQNNWLRARNPLKVGFLHQ